MIDSETILSIMSGVLGTVVVGSGAAALTVKYLGKSLLNQLLKKEIIKYKSQLEEKAILLKTNLSIYAEEQNIINQRIDSQKTRAISEVYDGVCRMNHHINKIAAGSPHRNAANEVHINFYFEHSEKAHELSSVVSDYLLRNAIFFDAKIYEYIYELWDKMTFSNAKFLTILRRVPPEMHLKAIGFNEVEIGKEVLRDTNEKEISPMCRELVAILRKEIGINKK